MSGEASPAAAAGPKSVPKSSVWELDFCSRPILDERGKKVWELLVCDAERSFEYARYFPNNKINSTEVGEGRGERALGWAGLPVRAWIVWLKPGQRAPLFIFTDLLPLSCRPAAQGGAGRGAGAAGRGAAGEGALLPRPDADHHHPRPHRPRDHAPPLPPLLHTRG